MNILKDKNITDVPGFQAVGIHSGVKKSGKNDLCVIYSERAAVSAATFTTNKTKAAPVLVDMDHVKSEITQAIVINSGNANACTGEQGVEDAMAMTKAVATCLNLSPYEVMVCSTGIIGLPMPMDVILPGIEKACGLLSKEGGAEAATAIMTTDTFTKKFTVEINIANKPVLISGIAKGSGMIHPNMGTMLGFVLTDANITKDMLNKALKDSVDNTYNMVSVDGDTSTNDTAIVLANGMANHPLIDSENDDYKAFKEGLDFVNKELAKLIAKDGEGATKLIEVSLHHGKTLKDAKLCAKSVICSSLVKTAFFGNDANWGRIVCALGYSTGDFVPEKVSITFKNELGSVQIAENGIGLPFDEELAVKILDHEYVNILIDLKDGEYSATAWGCDLSYDYVKINGDYRS